MRFPFLRRSGLLKAIRERTNPYLEVFDSQSVRDIFRRKTLVFARSKVNPKFFQSDRFQIQIADLGKSVDLFARFKLEPTVNARTYQDLKRAAECVLVNGGRAFEPEINVNVKTRAVVKRDRRIAEFRPDRAVRADESA